MIGYELKKLLGHKLICIITVILFLLNGVICFSSLSDNRYKIEDKQDIDSFFVRYYSDPIAIEEDHAEYNRRLQLALDAWRKAVEAGLEYDPASSSDDHSISKRITDGELYGILFNSRDSVSAYPGRIDSLLSEAHKNIGEMEFSGIPQTAFSYRYQNRVIDIYTYLRDNAVLGVEYTAGWGEYFNYYIGDLLTFGIILLLGSIIFAQETHLGSIQLIYISKNGRTKTVLCKLAAAYMIAAAAVILFALESFVITGALLGFGNPINAIQVYEKFLYCPLNITVIGYFFLRLFYKILTAFVYMSAVILFSLLLKRYIFSYIAGLTVLGLSAYVFFSNNFIQSSVRFMNPIAVSEINQIFSRYRAVDLFGYPADLHTVIAVGAVIIIAAANISINMLFTNMIVLSHSAAKLHLSKIKERLASGLPHKPRTYSGSIFRHEAYKLFISSGSLVIILILLILKLLICLGDVMKPQSDDDAIYEEYMTFLEGALTDGKKEYIISERKRISSAISSYGSMQASYISGEISSDEFAECMIEYNYAKLHDEPLQHIEDHLDYLERINTDQNDAWFIYDTGWKKLLNPLPDWTLYAALLLIFSGIFANEYDSRSSSGSFAQLLRSTRNGRKCTWSNKYRNTVAAAIALSTAWNVAEAICVILSYSFPSLSAPIMSISIFEPFFADIALKQYLLLFYISKICAILIFACFITSISTLLRNSLAVICVGTAVLIIPMIISNLGLKAAAALNYINYLCVTPLFLNVGHAVWGIIISLSVCIFSLLRSKRSWNS